MPSLSLSAKEEIQSLLLESVRNKKTPGLVFGATSVENELYFTHAGPLDMHNPSSDPVTDDSIFWLCSMTKLLVSLATLQLIEQGKLQLDTPASQILPELSDPVVVDGPLGTGNSSFKPAGGQITIGHLLNHSSGLTYAPEERHPYYYLPDPYTNGHDADDPVGYFYRSIKGAYPSLPLIFEPGSSWEYGYNSDSLGFIIERITGQSLEEYFQEHIFSPLGITSASFYLTPERRKKAVSLTFRGSDGNIQPWTGQVPLIEQDPSKVHLHLAGIGVYSSLKDYLTLLRHLLQIPAGTAVNPILSINSVNSLFNPTLSEKGAKSVDKKLQGTGLQWGNGLCLHTIDSPGKRKKGSGFWYGWAGTYYFLDPASGVALVFGTQIVPTTDAEVVELWGKLEEVFYRGFTN